MAQKKISITRALKELKLLDDRIQKSLQNPFISVQKGTTSSATVVGVSGVTIADQTTALKANLDKVEGLFKYRADLKAKVVQSNAVTEVTIGGKKMTVAVAIEQKAFVDTRKRYIGTLITQAQRAQIEVENGNGALENRIEAQIAAILGKEKGKVPTADERKEITGPMEANQKLSLIDPNKIGEKAKKLLEELDTFVNEVDFILSESNSTTTIEVDDGVQEAPAHAQHHPV